MLDLTERKRAEAEAHESERRYREIELALAHANRITTMGQLAASITHEIKQPINATAANAQAGLRWLQRQPPDLDEARRVFISIVNDVKRSTQVIDRIRNLAKNVPPTKEVMRMDEAIREILALTNGEIKKSRVSVRTYFSKDLPLVEGDRVQLQQVMLNLIVNAVDAMSVADNVANEVTDNGLRELVISAGTNGLRDVVVEVCDSGPGIAPESAERLFEPFYTTKAAGMGMGLPICRSIVEAHGGRLWVSEHSPHGAAFHFTVPIHPDGGQRIAH